MTLDSTTIDRVRQDISRYAPPTSCRGCRRQPTLEQELSGSICTVEGLEKTGCNNQELHQQRKSRKLTKTPTVCTGCESRPSSGTCRHVGKKKSKIICTDLSKRIINKRYREHVVSNSELGE